MILVYVCYIFVSLKRLAAYFMVMNACMTLWRKSILHKVERYIFIF